MRIVTGPHLRAAVPRARSRRSKKALTVFLLLRAFASGCTALTGIEAISNGIPAFKQPESHNAAVTLLWMAGILTTFFVGITLLAHQLGCVLRKRRPASAQMAQTIFGNGAAVLHHPGR